MTAEEVYAVFNANALYSSDYLALYSTSVKNDTAFLELACILSDEFMVASG